MLRLLATALVALLLTTTTAHPASGHHRGAGSAEEYEFMGGAMTAAGVAAPEGDCTLAAPHDDACIDDSACWVNDPAAVQRPTHLTTPRPRPEDHVVFVSCVTPSGGQWSRWHWSSEQPSNAA